MPRRLVILKTREEAYAEFFEARSSIPLAQRKDIYRKLGLSRPPKTQADAEEMRKAFFKAYDEATDKARQTFISSKPIGDRVMALFVSAPRATVASETAPGYVEEIEKAMDEMYVVPVDSIVRPGARPSPGEVTVGDILEALKVSFEASVAVPKISPSVIASPAWEEIKPAIVKGVKDSEEVEISFGSFSQTPTGDLSFSPGVSAQTFQLILDTFKGWTATADVIEIDGKSSYRRISTPDSVTYENKIRFRERTINVVDSGYRVSFSREDEGIDQAIQENFEPAVIRHRRRWSKTFESAKKKVRLDVTRVVQETVATRSKALQHEVEIEFITLPGPKPEIVSQIETIVLGGGIRASYLERVQALADYDTFTSSKSAGKGLPTAWMSKPTNFMPGDLPRSWSVTNKLDGQRRVLMISRTGVWVHSDPDFFRLSDSPKTIEAVLDCEYYEGRYYAFDCVYATVDVTRAPLRERLKTLEKVVRAIKDYVPIEMKLFYHPEDVLRESEASLAGLAKTSTAAGRLAETPPNPIYELVRRAQAEQDSTLATKEYDGFIFQSPGPYESRSARKWKPSDKLTIDFYLDHEDGDGVYVIHTWNKNRQMCVPWEGKWAHGKEVPATVTFESGKNGSVVECILEDGVWVVYRERPDKLYPNATYVAESVWSIIVKPIDLATISGKDLVLMRSYHNKVKSAMINSAIRSGQPDVIDFGTGQGGDIDKWVSAGVAHVWCVEPSEDMHAIFDERMAKKKKSVTYLERQAARLGAHNEQASAAIADKLRKLEANLAATEKEVARLEKSDAALAAEIRQALIESARAPVKTPAGLQTLLQARKRLNLELTQLQLKTTETKTVLGVRYFHERMDPDTIKSREMMLQAQRIRDFTYDWVPMGADDKHLLDIIGAPDPAKDTRVIFSFFSMTFMAESKKMDRLVANIDALLKVPGGMFVGMVLDGTRLRELVGEEGIETDAFSIKPTGETIKASHRVKVIRDGKVAGEAAKTFKYPQILTNINDPTSKVKNVTEWAFPFEAFAEKMATIRFKLMKTGFLDSGSDYAALGSDARLWSSMTRFFVFRRFSVKAPSKAITFPTGVESRIYEGNVLDSEVPGIYITPGLRSFFDAYLFCTSEEYELGPEAKRNDPKFDLARFRRELSDRLRKEIAASLDATKIPSLVDPKAAYSDVNLPLDPDQVCEYLSGVKNVTTVLITPGDQFVYNSDPPKQKLIVVAFRLGAYYPMVTYEGDEISEKVFTRESPAFDEVFATIEGM